LIYKFFKWSYNPFTGDVIKPSINWYKKTFIYNKLKLEKDPVKFRELAGKLLNENVFAQEKAVEKIIDIISGYIDVWKVSDDTGELCTSACVITCIGDSGTGKTLTARWLSRLLFDEDMQPFQYVTSTSVEAPAVPLNVPKVTVNFNQFGTKQNDDSDSSNKTKELSPADKLFNEKSELVHQLSKNNKIIVVIDEIDKIHKNDPQDTILERLRDAKDTGKLRVRLSNEEYMDIDVSRTVFICISNEFRECWGLPKEDLTPEEAAARTIVVRDRSLVNRFYVVEFKNFKKYDYMGVLPLLLAPIRESYARIYNMDIKFSKDFFEAVGQAAEDKNKGIRGLNDFVMLIRGVLVRCRSENKISENRNPKEAKERAMHEVIVKYNKSKDIFSVKAQKNKS
jgi:ATP-dependent Clp protease ATP-binding subunit ClpA